MVDRAIPRPCADDRSVLLQPARRWPARHCRSATEDVNEQGGAAFSLHLSPRLGRGEIIREPGEGSSPRTPRATGRADRCPPSETRSRKDRQGKQSAAAEVVMAAPALYRVTPQLLCMGLFCDFLDERCL